MILGPLPITSHDISANYTIQFMISMMSEISSFYAIGCLLLILCHLLMTHFYVIPYLLLYVVETTYRYKQSCIYIRPALTVVSIMRTFTSPSYKHPQFSHSSPKLLILHHYPQAYSCEFHTEYFYSLYCLHTIRYSCLSILIVSFGGLPDKEEMRWHAPSTMASSTFHKAAKALPNTKVHDLSSTMPADLSLHPNISAYKD